MAILRQPEVLKLDFGMNRWDNQAMKHHDANRHPGPWQVMRVDSECRKALGVVELQRTEHTEKNQKPGQNSRALSLWGRPR